MLLCRRRHHRLLHEGGYGVERLSSGLVRFRRKLVATGETAIDDEDVFGLIDSSRR